MPMSFVMCSREMEGAHGAGSSRSEVWHTNRKDQTFASLAPYLTRLADGKLICIFCTDEDQDQPTRPGSPPGAARWDVKLITSQRCRKKLVRTRTGIRLTPNLSTGNCRNTPPAGTGSVGRFRTRWHARKDRALDRRVNPQSTRRNPAFAG